MSAVVKSHFGDGRVLDDSLSSSNVEMNYELFADCSHLSCISTDITAWPVYGFPAWTARVAANGTFYCPRALSAIYDSSHIP